MKVRKRHQKPLLRHTGRGGTVRTAFSMRHNCPAWLRRTRASINKWIWRPQLNRRRRRAATRVPCPPGSPSPTHANLLRTPKRSLASSFPPPGSTSLPEGKCIPPGPEWVSHSEPTSFHALQAADLRASLRGPGIYERDRPAWLSNKNMLSKAKRWGVPGG